MRRPIAPVLAPLTYGLLILIPLILVVISLVQDFAVTKVIMLALLLLVAGGRGEAGGWAVGPTSHPEAVHAQSPVGPLPLTL